MPHGFDDRNAKRYSRYTGLSHAPALQQVRNRSAGTPWIPEPTGPQRLLEALVFEHLRGDIDYFTHPVGISYVVPCSDRITVCLDGSATSHGHPLTSHALEMLLPAELPADLKGGDGEEVHGVPGLRIARVSARSLTLTMAESNARVLLTCAGKEDWRALVASREAELIRAGFHPCWNEPDITRPEAVFQHRFAGLCRAAEEASWLTSGLLRRIGLLHEVSAAYCTRYWSTYDDWKFELKHDPGVRPPHEEFISWLADPKWGIDLTVDKHHCDCDAPWLSPEYDRQCTVELSSPRQHAGTLQLRFRAMGTWCSSHDTYADLQRAGADSKWLRRVMPQHHERRDRRG